MSRLYKIREFADLAGVTVRTLHHYDRIGLLKPRRSRAGYRLYFLTDLERLVQITALKFIGIPLHEIRVLLEASPLSLAESLRLQHKALKEKRDLITRAIQAIEEAERLVRPDRTTDASVLRKIIEVIEMKPEANSMRKYYTEEAWARKIQLGEQIPPEALETCHHAWKKLFLEVEAALEVDPAGETGQSLARQWVLLGEMMSGGDSEIKAAAIKAWKDHRNWPLAEQDALLARYGLDARRDREVSIRRVERVARFIGQAIGRKYVEALRVEQQAAVADNPSADDASKSWAALFREVEASLSEDPASPKVQALVARWKQSKLDKQVEVRGVLPGLVDFQKPLRERPTDASVAVVNKVARLYRIEQVSNFLMKALACSEGSSNPSGDR
jgi:MerR family transcriptional regulator, thiopeptide resistance regulator